MNPNVNYQVSIESIKLLRENNEFLKMEGFPVNNIYLLLRKIKEEFIEELKIGCNFNNDINDYIEYIIERCESLYVR